MKIPRWSKVNDHQLTIDYPDRPGGIVGACTCGLRWGPSSEDRTITKLYEAHLRSLGR